MVLIETKIHLEKASFHYLTLVWNRPWEGKGAQSRPVQGGAHILGPVAKMYFSKLFDEFLQIAKWIVQIVKCISSNQKMYLSKLKSVFVKGYAAALFRMRPIVWAQYPHRLIICPNFKMYLTKMLPVFAQITKHICTNDCNVFVQIVKCIVWARPVSSSSDYFQLPVQKQILSVFCRFLCSFTDLSPNT